MFRQTLISVVVPFDQKKFTSDIVAPIVASYLESPSVSEVIIVGKFSDPDKSLDHLTSKSSKVRLVIPKVTTNSVIDLLAYGIQQTKGNSHLILIHKPMLLLQKSWLTKSLESLKDQRGDLGISLHSSIGNFWVRLLLRFLFVHLYPKVANYSQVLTTRSCVNAVPLVGILTLESWVAECIKRGKTAVFLPRFFHDFIFS